MVRKVRPYPDPSLSWTDGLLRNDPTTIESLYTAHFPAVKQFVLKNSGTTDDAKDIFQEAVTVVWLKVREGTIAGAEVGAGPGGLIYTIARCKWLDVVRSARVKKMHVVSVDGIAAKAELEDDGVEERIQRFQRAYDQLGENCRTLLDKFYHERKDLASIAAEMNVHVDSIRTIKYRCMMKLRSFRAMILEESNTPQE